MRLLYNLASKRYFWVIWNKAARFKFHVNKRSYLIKSDLQNQKDNFSILKEVIKLYYLKLGLLLITIFVVEYVEKKLGVAGAIKSLFPSTIFDETGSNKKGMSGIYPGIAALFTAFVTIYFASISIIASTSYLKLSTETTSLIWKERGNYFFYNYLVSLIIISLILTALNSFGYNTGYVVFGATVLLAVIGLMAFAYLTVRLFGFFSPVSLLDTCLVPNIERLIDKATINRKQFPELQKHCQDEVDINLTLIESILRAEFPHQQLSFQKDATETTHSESEVGKLVQQLCRVLTHYSSYKQRIPLDSLWYKKRSEHKSYFETDYFSEISITSQTDTTLLASEIPDLMWFEKKIATSLEIIFKYIFLTKNHRLCAVALNSLQVYIEIIIEQADHNTALFILEYLGPTLQKSILEINPKFNETKEALVEDKILAPLAIANYYGCIFISVMLGYRKRIEGLSAKIGNLDLSSKKSLYKSHLPPEVVAKLVDLHKKLKFEMSVEGKIISKKYYIDQLTATAVLDFTSSIPDKIIELLEENLIKFSEAMIRQKNYLMLFPLFERIFEAMNKTFTFSEQLEKTETEFFKLIKINDIPHVKTDIDSFRQRLMRCRKTTLKNFSKIVPLISLMPKRDSTIPDYFGSYYFRLSKECLEGIIKNDVELFAKLFPAYFLHSFSVYSYLLSRFNDPKSNKVYWSIRMSDIITNLFTISGYALIYREIGQRELWQTVDSQWQNITTLMKEDSVQDAMHSLIRAASNKEFFASPTQQVRFDWDRKIMGNLAHKKIIEERNRNPFGGGEGRKHESDILEIISRNVSFFSWHYSADVVFAACYIKELPNDQSELTEKAKRFIEDLEELKDDQKR
jgi:hypothetical protein